MSAIRSSGADRRARRDPISSARTGKIVANAAAAPRGDRPDRPRGATVRSAIRFARRYIKGEAGRDRPAARPIEFAVREAAALKEQLEANAKEPH